MTRSILLLTIFFLPGSLNAQFIAANPPGPDYCASETVTYTYFAIDPNNTIQWFVDDYGPFSWLGAPGTTYAGTGPVLTIPPFIYSAGIVVRVQESDASGIVYEAYEYAVFKDALPIPVYYENITCGALIAAPPFNGDLSLQRWSMWYLDGIEMGLSHSYLDGPLREGTYQYKLVLGCSNDTLSTDPYFLNGFPEPQIDTSGTTTFCDGDSVTLTLQPWMNVLHWRHNNTVIPGTSGKQSITAKISGDYRVTVYSTQGLGSCYQTSSPVSITVNPAAIISGLTEECSGETVTLQCTPATSYQWKRNGTDIPGATSQTLQVTQGGNYKVVTTGLTCNISKVHNLKYFARPSALSISQSGNISLCKNEALTLTMSGNNITSWNWLRGGVSMEGGNTPSITVTKAGNYKCVVSNAIGCSKTSQVAKLTTPAAIDLPFKSVTIKPGPSGSDSYTTCAFGNFGTNFGNAATIEVSAWYKHFRTADRGYLKFNLSSIPEQSPIVSATLKLYTDTSVVYQNGLQTLFVKRLTEDWLENTINWYNAPDSSVFQKSSIPVTAAQSNTTVSLTVTDIVRHWSFMPSENYGLLLHLDEITNLTVKPGWMSFYSGDHSNAANRPKLTVKYSYADITENGPLSFCAGGSVTFSTNPGYNYQWYLDNNAIPGANAENYTAITAGDYYVLLSNAAGCSVKSATKTVTVPCREMNFITDEIQIIHQQNNPEIKVILPAGEGVIAVYNMTGQLISTFDCRERDCIYSKPPLSSGMYLIHVTSGTLSKTGKFVIE